jgi:hypothetical protein
VAGWLLLLAGVAASMAALGRGALAGPPLLAPGDWPAWAADRGPAAASVAVVRVVVLAVAGWLLVVTVVSLLVGAVRPGRLSDLVDLLSVPLVRRVVHGALGVGLAGATAAGVGGLGGRPVPVPVPPAAVASAPPAPTSSPGRAADVLLTTPTTTATTTTTAALPPEPVTPPATGPAPPAEPRTWRVAPGDHLWSIAEDVLGEALGRPVDDGEVAGYWRRLVAANRERLADPANPDLLFAGDLLVVPDPPVPSAR